MGLPHFTFSTGYFIRQLANKSGKVSSFQDGCYLTRIDITQNFGVGQGNEIPFIRGLATIRLPYTSDPKLELNNCTVSWGQNTKGKSSRHKYQKVYAKAQELKDHFKPTADTDLNEYTEKLINYCQSLGILRQETSLKFNFFDKHKQLKYLKPTTTLENFMPHAQSINNAISTLSVNNTQYESIREQLLSSGICTPREASSTEYVYDLYRHGRINERSDRTLRRHRQRLLAIGIDISTPCDLTMLPIKIKSDIVIDINTNLPIPDWYEMPASVTHLRAV